MHACNCKGKKQGEKSKFTARYQASIKHILKPQQIPLHYHHVRVKAHLSASAFKNQTMPKT